MGLYEKRILVIYKTQCQNEIFPKLKQLGDLNLTIEVSWDDIYKEFNTRDASAARFTIEDLDRYMNYAFYSPVTVAIEAICSDTLGRDLIKKSLNELTKNNNTSLSLGSIGHFKSPLINLGILYLFFTCLINALKLVA